MVTLLLVIAIASVIVSVILYQRKKVRDRNLGYMAEKLNALVTDSSSEQLLLMTDDQHLQTLLIEINRLLDDNRKGHAQFSRTEHSMKKMLANISHDLKTPLTVVLGYIEMIQNDPDVHPEERDRLLGNIHKKTLEIISLMNAFFDLAKLESGDKEIPLAKVQINEICRQNILSFYDLIQSKGCEAVIHIPDEPVFVQGNEEALTSVLDNLISNAIRYGGDGKTIGLTLSYDEKKVYIEVWDRGKGIREPYQELVFERMFTLEESRNRSFQGSGLGLTITKRLVEEMGGEILLQSKPFHKTTFTVQLQRWT
ncbi:sensor histidine kinase [Brevibacillus ruminantium]|uniref:histidine kinase n=1 Tax=Brevibacillus ruminantium TaxID=2950604 RepID=A0ABY4WF26_9BACL|nr:sensor histidine kinase [Brevibacillus ruminantium]USG65628.1 sensor histidine kinase [Brevibacillus ruminantium]